MRALTGGFRVLQRFQAVQGLSFSTSSREHPKFNILFFCPRNEEHFVRFHGEYPDFIKSVNPESVAVTDIASKPENNIHAIRALLRSDITGSMIIPHLTLIGHDKEDTDQKIRFFEECGIKSVFLVKGNPKVFGRDKDYAQHPEGYKDMPQLMARVKELVPAMKIIIAGYPEKHPYAKSFDEDMDSLKRKVDCGADMIITQHFFGNDPLLIFLEQCQKRKIDIPVIPSILPIGNPKYLFSFCQESNVDIPAQAIRILLEKDGMTAMSDTIGDPVVRMHAAEYTAKQIQDIVDLQLPQVPKINLYTANNIGFLKEVFGILSLTEETKSRSM